MSDFGKYQRITKRGAGKRNDWQPPVSSETGLISEFEYDGFRIAFLRKGRSGSDVVFLHGLYCCSTIGVPLVNLLADRHRVWAPDLPGFGLSGGFPGEQSIDEACRALEAFLSRSCALPVRTVIGHSMGATIAIRLAGLYPHLTQSLILINAPGIPAKAPLWAKGLASPRLSRVTGWTMRTMISFGWMLCKIGVIKAGSSLSSLFDGGRQAGMKETCALCQTALALDPEETTRAVGNLPALILGGTNDRVLKPEHTIELQRLLPHAVVHWLPGGDHLAPYLDADRVSRHISGFLKRFGAIPGLDK